eukprot:4955388-Amphidinium_carterae.1
MDEAGGALFPQDSVPGQKLKNFVNKPWDQHANLAIPLYQESGAYNLYMRPSADLSSTETASAVGVCLRSGGQAASAASAGLSTTETAGAVGTGLSNKTASA